MNEEHSIKLYSYAFYKKGTCTIYMAYLYFIREVSLVILPLYVILQIKMYICKINNQIYRLYIMFNK